jgi:Protein of unknown function (DUF3667)
MHSPQKLTIEPGVLTFTPGEIRSVACLNCGAPLTGSFCAECGQRDIPPYPSTRELVVDAFWELSGWDGRFASTVRALVQRPGMLTREFLEGRRARFLSPLRLYLLASLAYFLIAAAVPNSMRVKTTITPTAGIATTSAAPKSRPERVAEIASGSLTSQKTLPPAELAAALKDVEKAPELIRPMMRKSIADPTGFKRGIFETMPRMLFALLPLFAAIVALFYRGRKYPEHLYFAIHFHAFVFLALSVGGLAKLAHVPALATAVGTVAKLWIPVYATLAFRRVYGGSLFGTLAKEFAILVLYSLASMVAMVVLIYWVSVAN